MPNRSVIIISGLALAALGAILTLPGRNLEPNASPTPPPPRHVSIGNQPGPALRGAAERSFEPAHSVGRLPVHARGEPDVEAERAALHAEVRAYKHGATNVFFHEQSFRRAFLAQAGRKLPAMRASMRDVEGLLELPEELDIALTPPAAVTDRMATLDLLGDLAGEDEDACELLIELLLEPIDLKLPDHVKRVLVAERYEAMTRLASIDWERARTTFQRLPFQGLRDVLRPALAEGLAASGLPYEDAFVVAQNA